MYSRCSLTTVTSIIPDKQPSSNTYCEFFTRNRPVTGNHDNGDDDEVIEDVGVLEEEEGDFEGFEAEIVTYRE